MEVSRVLLVATAAALFASGPGPVRAAPPAPAPTPAPLTARATTAAADGTRLVPIDVRGGPPRREAEREDHPALPAVTCVGATTLPPTPGRPPLVMAPFRAAGGTLDCVVRLRDATAPFTVVLERPASGVFALLEPPAPRAADRKVLVRGVVVEPGHAARNASRLRAAASAGVRVTLAAATATLELPAGAAPRAVAVVLEIEGRPAAAFFPLLGRAELPVRTRHARSVTVRMPGVYAGPFEVRGDRVAVPVDVPPGVGVAVVRALSARGEAREEIVDLSPPQLPRLAVLVPDGSIPVRATSPVWIAVADHWGAPATAVAPPTARPQRGTAGAAIRRGPGLWEIPYRAPATPGPDPITVSVPGDPGAGAVEARLDVSAGAPRGLRIALPRYALEPGARLVAHLTVRDHAGNPLRDLPLRATLGGAPAGVEPSANGYVVTATIPDRLPARSLRLVVEGAGAHLGADVAVRAGPAASARLTLHPAGRRADVRVLVADRHGNAVAPDHFTLRASGGRVSALVADGDGYRATLDAEPTAREATVEVVAGGQSLARAQARFAPPPGSWRLGAWAGGAWLTNLGDVSAARFGGGPAVRRALGPIELTLAAGIEGLAWSGARRQLIAGAERSVARELTVVAMPVTLRARLPLPRQTGVAVALGVVPTWARGRVDAEFQTAETFTRWVGGVRGEAAGDLAVGPGRVVLAAGYGRATLDGTPITGNVDGLYVRAGYEWWFWAPGW